MTNLLRCGAALALALTMTTGVTNAQEPRLAQRLPEPAQAQVQAILDSARATGIPTEPLVDRALEGLSKGAAPNLIVTAVRRLAGEMRAARTALGARATRGELQAGASALRAGATVDDLASLRRTRTGQLTVATAVLADLVAVGVPADTAVMAVLALAERAADTEYLAFRRNVERDIALGASPVAALGVHVNALAAEGRADLAPPFSDYSPPQPRKP